MNISLTSIFVDDPIAAHQFYTEVLGFVSKQFMPEGQIAIVVSPEDPGGTGLLLEPHGATFAKDYQDAVREAGMPVIIFGSDDVDKTRAELEAKGVCFRDDLARPDWGITNVFEDGFGNFIMLARHEAPA